MFVQVRLVLELCDMGTLQDLLARGGFRSPSGHYNMAGLVATAADVARAMLHLHTEHIIHGDLKVGVGGACVPLVVMFCDDGTQGARSWLAQPQPLTQRGLQYTGVQLVRGRVVGQGRLLQ
jgi:serine/threonine protein kinase